MQGATRRAGFSEDVQAALSTEPGLIAVIASRLLEQHLPGSLHQDILDAVERIRETSGASRKRDPDFRRRVLTDYEYRCAVCGFDVMLGSVSIALDAVRIRWHQAGGPDEETNGLAPCVLHHKMFDLGAFTLSDGVILVSDRVRRTSGFHETLMAYDGRAAREPRRPDWRPEPKYLDWHGRKVFKGEPRHRR